MRTVSKRTPLTQSEVKDLVDTWYARLDVHAPIEEVMPLLADQGLHMVFPESTLDGLEAFARWYHGALHTFFDEVHTTKRLAITPAAESADVALVVNWQASRWRAPVAKSERLNFDAEQKWVVVRSLKTGKPVIQTYEVVALTPLEGSAPL